MTGHGDPVARDVLLRMTERLAKQGPDRQDIWLGQGAGLGHALLATTDEAVDERQPCSLDQEVWISADCRVDAREELWPALEAQGRRNVRDAKDPELILHAYHAWGDACVEHLLGDFAFCIWDSRRRRMFCARDQFGVKPLYYATPDGGLAVSNDVGCLRLHPGVSGRWNDAAICEFLMFGLIADEAITTFADIQCLPPANTLVWENGDVTLHRYWRLPIVEPIRFRRPQDYVDRFSELLGAAVKDRIRTGRISVLMSGGLDSSLLAATAKRVSGCDIRAKTVVFENLISNDERFFAEAVAHHIGIPIDLHFADDDVPFDGAAERLGARPEPKHNPGGRMRDEVKADIERHGRVVFYGEGPDNLLGFEHGAYLRYLRSHGQSLRAAAEVVQNFCAHPRVPQSIRRAPSLGNPDNLRKPAFPDNLQPEMIERLELRERWARYWGENVATHPYHPRSYASMFTPLWRRLLADGDPSIHGHRYETRHPYLDVRVMSYLISLPVIPWCRKKLIMRRAGAGLLPEAVLQRRKTPLWDDPVAARRKRGLYADLEWPPLSEFARYVTHWPDVEGMPRNEFSKATTAVSLGYWWRGQQAQEGLVNR